MNPISDGELLAMWEAAQAAPSVLRPAMLLRAAGEDAPEHLPIGERDRRLLTLRAQWFGTSFEAVVDCPHCHEPAELTFDAADVARGVAVRAEDERAEVPFAFRLPDSTDLAAIAGAVDEADARARLAARCITGDVRDDAAIEAVARAMSAADPLGDLTVDVVCPECGASWEALFDPAAYMLRELDAAAVRLFREIDALAVAYGWTEREILSLSRTRRRTYLRMVTQ